MLFIKLKLNTFYFRIINFFNNPEIKNKERIKNNKKPYKIFN